MLKDCPRFATKKKILSHIRTRVSYAGEYTNFFRQKFAGEKIILKNLFKTLILLSLQLEIYARTNLAISRVTRVSITVVDIELSPELSLENVDFYSSQSHKSQILE